jgi:VWFA-related protein
LLGVPVLVAGLWAGAQQMSSSQDQVPLLRKDIRLVLVDVVVTDKKGNPVRGLTRDDFAVKENGQRQEVAVFEWEGPTEEPRPSPPPLPPNVYTNRPEYHPPPGPLTIVLLDAVNTPRTDQVRMREEILGYLDSHFRSGQRTAILALTDRVLVLQDFTADRDLLMAAVKKYTPKGSTLLGIRESMTSRDEDYRRDLLRDVGNEYGAGDPALKALIEDILQAEENFLAMTDKARMERTLAGLRAIAQAVVGYPGRKNLIWVSAAFPSMYAGDPYGRQQWSMGGELRRTARLLQDARVAIYPVDPRGVKPAFKPESYREFKDRMDRAGRPRAWGGNPKASVPTASVRHPQYNLVTSQMSMKTIADTTGGLAFYNRNDISNAVALALADGAAYYTLGYYPANKELDGKFRRIQVKLARKGLRLRYRKGYYATEMPEAAEEAENRDGEVPEGEGESGLEQRNARQLRAALYHPLPATGLTFRAYVSPPEAAAPAQVQEEIQVEFWLEGGGLTFQPQGEGRQRIDLDFVVAAFTPQGVQVNNVAQRFRHSLTLAEYQQALKTGMNYPMSIELEPGSYQLRLLVRDNPSGRLGRVDAPLRVAAPQTAVAH